MAKKEVRTRRNQSPASGDSTPEKPDDPDGYVSPKQIADLSKSYDPEVLPVRKVAETTREARLGHGKGAVLKSDVAHFQLEAHREGISFLTADKNRSRKLDQKPVEAGLERAMIISPFLPPVDVTLLPKDSDFKVAPVSKAFLPDNPPCTRVISRNLADDFNKKEKLVDERIQNPLVDHRFGKENPAAAASVLIVPGNVSQEQVVDFEVLLAERVAKATRKGIKERLAYGKGPVLESDIALFRLAAERKRVNSLVVEDDETLSRARSNQSSNLDDNPSERAGCSCSIPEEGSATKRETSLGGIGGYEVPHIVEGILLRSPVHSLARFKLVCKEWNSLLSEHSFICKQLKFGQNQKRFIHLRQSQVWELNPVAQRSCYLQIRDFEKEVIRNLVECNGLLLCSTLSKKIVIWNRNEARWIEKDDLSLYDTYSLGHDGKNLYKLMRFNFGPFDLDDRECYDPEAEVYEFSSNSWRRIGFTGDWSVVTPSMMVSVNGNSYWLSSSAMHKVFLQSFDFSTESFRAIPLLKIPIPDDVTFSLSSFGGCGLSLISQHVRELSTQVWVTKNARDSTVLWEKLYDVSRHHLPMIRGQSFFIKNDMILKMYSQDDDEAEQK